MVQIQEATKGALGMACRNLIVWLGLVVFSPAIFAADLLRYAEVSIEVSENHSVLLKHKAIVELGKPVHLATGKPGQSQAARLDYEVAAVTVTEDGLPVAILAGTAFRSSLDEQWVVLSEFRMTVPLETAVSHKLRHASGSEVSLSVKIDGVAEQSLKDRFGNSVPAASTCPPEMTGVEMQHSLDSDCCSIPCSNCVMECCGAVTCCEDTACGPNCCCSP